MGAAEPPEPKSNRPIIYRREPGSGRQVGTDRDHRSPEARAGRGESASHIRIGVGEGLQAALASALLYKNPLTPHPHLSHHSATPSPNETNRKLGRRRGVALAAMDSDYGVPRELSEVQKKRALYQPELPPCLQVRTSHHSCYVPCVRHCPPPGTDLRSLGSSGARSRIVLRPDRFVPSARR